MASVQAQQQGKEGIENGGVQEQVRVTTRNISEGTMWLLNSHGWSGQVLGEYPPALAAGSTGGFVHLGSPPYGSKAAIIYSGTNNSGQQCAWLLAWWDQGNKVYVKTGLEKDFVNIDWNDVEYNLNASSSNAGYTDDNTRTHSTAGINTTGVLVNFIALPN